MQCLLYSQYCGASEGGLVHELDPTITHVEYRHDYKTWRGMYQYNTRKILINCQQPREVLTLTTHKRQDMPVYFPPLDEIMSPNNTPYIRKYLILIDSAMSSGEWMPETSCAPVSTW